MSIVGAKIASIAFPSTGVEKLRDESPKTLEAEKARLKKAAKEFESFFMYQILKTMRKTVPESSFNEGAPFSGDMGKDIFSDMFDMQLSQKMVTGDSKSISEILYRSLVKSIEVEYLGEEAPVQIKPLEKSEPEAVRLNQQIFEEVPKTREMMKIKPEVEDLLPISTRRIPLKGDRILSEFGGYIEKAAKQTNLDPALIISVIKAESNGNPEAVSPAGAKGLMQLIDTTASDYGVTEVFDPQQNIEAGSRFLKDLVDRFGSIKLALAAYNAGPENVKRYGGIPPFKETQAYVEKVMDTLNTFSGSGSNATAKEPY